MWFWGKKNDWCYGGEGSSIRESRERDREWEREALHKKNTSPKPLMRKTRGADNHKFLQAVELKLWSFRSLHYAGVRHGRCRGAPMEDVRGPGVHSVVWGSPVSHWEDSSPSCSAFGRGSTDSLVTKAAGHHWAAPFISIGAEAASEGS